MKKIAVLVFWSLLTTPSLGQVVDFSYAIAPPHRMTAARPSGSDKTLLDLNSNPNRLGLNWTYNNLTTVLPLGSYKPVMSDHWAEIIPKIDDAEFVQSTGRRVENLPILENIYQNNQGRVKLIVAGAESAMICQVEATNRDDEPHIFTLSCTNKAGDAVEDYLVENNRVLLLQIGGDKNTANENKTLQLTWQIPPGQTKIGWLIRPYNSFTVDLTTLRSTDWQKQFTQAQEEWANLIHRAIRIDIPDANMEQAYYSCLGDLFIMQEPTAKGYIAGTAGTEVYRANNDAEPGMAVIDMDLAGLHQEAEQGYRMNLDSFNENGSWIGSGSWQTNYWWTSGWKTWVVMEHYYLTNDQAYLENVYPRMLADSLFLDNLQSENQDPNFRESPAYGMITGGTADCGLADGQPLYFSHNIWSVYKDRMTLEAAKILNKENDIPKLERMYQQNQQALLRCLEKGAIQEEGYCWIPGVPNSTAGSAWSSMHTLFPCRILDPFDDLITGSIHHYQSNISPGGLPMHTGFMVDGMWVSTTLDHLAMPHLLRGESDSFVKYLYAVLNHASPLYTWPEERGKDAHTTARSGDLQHLYSPAMVTMCIRYALLLEDGNDPHIARGAARNWLGSGKPLVIEQAPTHFGTVSWRMQYNSKEKQIKAIVEFPQTTFTKPLAKAILHMNLPSGLTVKSINTESGATVLPDGSGVQWSEPKGVKKVVAMIEKMER